MHALPPVVEDAITALHEAGYRSTAIELEALFNEQPTPQPVGSVVWSAGIENTMIEVEWSGGIEPPVGTKLYAHPPPSAPVGAGTGSKESDDLQLDAIMSTAAVVWGWLRHVTEPDDRVGAARDLLGQMLNKDLKRYGIQTAKAEGARVNMQGAEAQPDREPADWPHQGWEGMDGATAWHLIERHASGWQAVGEMMDTWLSANSERPPAEAPRCTCPSGDGSLRWPCPAHPPEAQPVWATDKPKRPGVYGVRGFNMCRKPEDQFEAIVSVRLHEGDLICNLYESTSEEDFDHWARVDDFSDGFEWCEFVPANDTPSAPEAQGGGEVEYEFEVWQDNVLQAGGSASDYAPAKSEADHYALMYGQDGPVEVRMYVKHQITSPPSAPVGVEDLSCCGGNDETPKSHCMDCSRYPGQLAQQPAAVDGDNPYPAPRNRQEAAALAKLALAYLGVTSAHINAVVARCETDLAGQQGGPQE